MYNGLINIYKEPDFTSFDVVAILRGILKQKKIGHTGTLDPKAEGVLLVCLGDGTKLCELLDNRDKEYVCKMLLGRTTDTEDTTGKILSEKAILNSKEEIIDAVMSMQGDILQVPPMYSALKKDGKKLYELARAGKEVEREARPVTIYNIEILNIELPYVTFKASCSKGTYIRSLCRDIGEKLGCGACMEHLKRTRVSYFTEEKSLKLSEVEKLAKEGQIDDYILPVEAVFEKNESLYVNEASKRIVDNGNPLTRDNVSLDKEKAIKNGTVYKVYNAEGRFAAVYKYDKYKDLFMPLKMFPNIDS